LVSFLNDLPDSPQFDADELDGTLSALAKHLQRLGAQFLPQGDASAGGAWLQRHIAAPASTLPSASEAASSAEAANTPSSSALAEAPKAVPVVPASTQPPAVSVESPQSPYPVSLPLADRQQQLQTLAAQVAGCTACAELACSRKQTVFGEGNPQARVCFFGEAPGAEEDRQGRPFVGPAGQLLTKMIEACTLRREDVYILNTLKCRPPENRNPLPHELDHCRGFFEAQFDLVQPEYIVCLGLFATQSLLRSKLSIGRLRGRFHAYRNSKVLVTYHPSYLLRTASAKKLAWTDLQLLMADMGVRR